MEAAVCPRCGLVNGQDARFCIHCGLDLAAPAPQANQEPSPLRKLCAGCRTVSDAAFRYCYRCGLALPESVYRASLVIGDPAGFWVRTLAYLIDAAILLVASVLVFAILTGTGLEQVQDELTGSSEVHCQRAPGLGIEVCQPTGGTLAGDGLDWEAALINLLIDTAYYTLMVGRWGRTVGKLVLGLRVVRTNGSRLTYRRSFARSWAYLVSFAPAGLGILAIVLSPQKRGWHDLLCDTRVLRGRP
jgi:uncharacterized RDD family membrane protein YckC